MSVQQEGNLLFHIPDPIPHRKFDGPEHHLSHCMKVVDYIIETPVALLFIEIKDPDNPGVKQKDRSAFTKKLKSHKLISNELVPKYRDTFLYEYGMNRMSKPVYYYVILCLDILTEADLANQTDYLEKNIPIHGPKGVKWVNEIISRGAVFNMQTWNTLFPEFKIDRKQP